MTIRERKGKNGITFQIICFDGYKRDKNNKLIQNRKYKTFKPPKDMGIRKARQIAREMELEMQSQFEHQENIGSEKRLSEVWNWYKTYYAPNKLRETTIDALNNIMEIKLFQN